MWGGKRAGSGRAKGSGKDWNQYKKNAKKKMLEKAAKSNTKLDTFIVKKVISNTVQEQSNIESISNSLSESNVTLQEDFKDFKFPDPLPYFQNGCKIPGIDSFYCNIV